MKPPIIKQTVATRDGNCKVDKPMIECPLVHPPAYRVPNPMRNPPTIISIKPFRDEEVEIYDIRRPAEYESEHLEDAHSKPLADINDWIKDINPNKHFFLHCASGYRTMIASSILLSRGYRNFTEIEGGMNAIRKTELPKSKFVKTINA